MPRTLTLRVHGMDCAEEVAILRRALSALPGAGELSFDILEQRLSVSFDPARLDEAALCAAIAATGMRAEPAAEAGEPSAGAAGAASPPSLVSHRWGAAVTAVLLLAGLLVHALSGGGLAQVLTGQGAPPASDLLYLLGAAAGVLPLLRKAFYAARSLRPDMHLLMLLAIAGAVILGDRLEAATVGCLFALSLALETWSVGRARRAVAALLDLSPRDALLLRAGPAAPGVPAASPTAGLPALPALPAQPVLPDAGRRVPAADVPPGSLVLVRAGERVPLDGVVAAGLSAVDESPITGESVPAAKEPGDEVFAGTINGAGVLEVTTTRAARDTTLARIVRLVGQAQGRRSPSERFVERFAAVYSPAVLVLALIAGLLPPLLGLAGWQDAVYRALVLLVIACPCALVISTPVSVVSALASAARAGVLIKGGRFIEEPSRAVCFAFDKTGTLTAGRPVVRQVIPFDHHDEAHLLGMAAAIEARSTHPLADAIVSAARGAGCERAPARDVRDLPGRGAEAVIDGRPHWVGSHRLLEERGQETPAVHETLVALEAAGNSVVILGNDQHVCGLIALGDEPRPEAAQAVRGLHAAGVRHVVMLTGDNSGTAQAIAARLGVDDVRAGLLPADKVSAVAALVQEHGHVVMVGDGVNDAPALATASLGIAMGGAGSDAAIETADIVIMADDLLRLPWLVRHSHRTVAIIRQNIVAALAIKALFIVLAALGWASLWGAIAADMGVSLTVVGNAMRLLGARRDDGPDVAERA